MIKDFKILHINSHKQYKGKTPYSNDPATIFVIKCEGRNYANPNYSTEVDRHVVVNLLMLLQGFCT